MKSPIECEGNEYDGTIPGIERNRQRRKIRINRGEGTVQDREGDS